MHIAQVHSTILQKNVSPAIDARHSGRGCRYRDAPLVVITVLPIPF